MKNKYRTRYHFCGPFKTSTKYHFSDEKYSNRFKMKNQIFIIDFNRLIYQDKSPHFPSVIPKHLIGRHFNQPTLQTLNFKVIQKILAKTRINVTNKFYILPILPRFWHKPCCLNHSKYRSPVYKDDLINQILLTEDHLFQIFKNTKVTMIRTIDFLNTTDYAEIKAFYNVVTVDHFHFSNVMYNKLALYLGTVLDCPLNSPNMVRPNPVSGGSLQP